MAKQYKLMAYCRLSDGSEDGVLEGVDVSEDGEEAKIRHADYASYWDSVANVSFNDGSLIIESGNGNTFYVRKEDNDACDIKEIYDLLNK